MPGALSELKTFIAVAETQSFTAAGRAVKLSTSAVSKCITDLEHHLGSSLIQRTTHQVSLTQAGDIFYRSCVRMLTEFDEARSEVKASEERLEGSLRVHAPLCAGQSLISPLVTDFIDEHPKISVTLIVNPGPVLLSRFNLDLIIRTKYWKTEEGVVQRQLGLLDYRICAAPRYLELRGVPEVPQDLDSHNCLIHSTQDEANDWAFTGKKRRRVQIVGTFSSNSSLSVLAAVRKGIGIARLPSYVVDDDIRSGRLVSLFHGEVACNRAVSAYYPRSKRQPSKLLALVDFFQKRLQKPDARS